MTFDAVTAATASVWQTHGLEIRFWLGFAAVAVVLAWKGRGMFSKLDQALARLETHVEKQNGRIGRQSERMTKLEGSVMYQDTCQAMHGQNSQAIARIETELDKLGDNVGRAVELMNLAHHVRSEGSGGG